MLMPRFYSIEEPAVTTTHSRFPFLSNSKSFGKKKNSEMKEVDKDCRKDYPKMFPQDYVFGKDDSLFK